MGKRVDIEYIGDPPLLDDATKLKLAMGDYPDGAAAVLRGAETVRDQAIKGVTKRIVDPEWFGTSRQYVFGPDVYIVAVEAEDVDKILGSPSAHQFRRVGDLSNMFVRAPSHITPVSEVVGKSLYDVYQ